MEAGSKKVRDRDLFLIAGLTGRWEGSKKEDGRGGSRLAGRYP